MACRLNGAKPLSEAMLFYRRLGKNFNGILIQTRNFVLKKMH